MAEQKGPSVNRRDELAALSAYYQGTERKPEFGVVGESYIAELAEAKELRHYLRKHENPSEAAIQSGSALYFGKLSQFSASQYANLMAQTYNGPALQLLRSLGNMKIGELAKAASEYAAAEKEAKGAAKNKDRKKQHAAEVRMDALEVQKNAYDAIMNADEYRLQAQHFPWVAKEIIGEQLGGLEKFVSSRKNKKKAA